MKSKRVKIVIALGSNVDQEAHILNAKKWLEATFEDMTFGTSLWTEPIGLSSDKFLNTLGVGYTNVNMERTLLAIKNIERKCGRRVAESRKGIIAVDIDLLLFDSERLHETDWNRGYVKNLLQQLGVCHRQPPEANPDEGTALRQAQEGRQGLRRFRW